MLKALALSGSAASADSAWRSASGNCPLGESDGREIVQDIGPRRGRIGKRGFIKRPRRLKLAAPMGGLASSLASVNFGCIHNVESLNRAYTLFHDLDAIPHDAPKRKSGRRSSIRDSVRTSDASMRDLSEDLSLELAGFDPNVLRAVC